MCDDILPLSPAPLINYAFAEPEQGYRSLRFGPIAVTALWDGHFPLDAHAVLRTNNLPLSALLDSARLGKVIPSHVNAFLVDDGAHRILIDAGAGSLQDATLGKMSDQLVVAGYRSEDIDTVLVTHLHPDHIGGLSQDGEALFPKARVYVPREEACFWLDAHHQNQVDPSVRETFRHARTIMAPYIADGRCDFFEHGMSWYSIIFSEHLAGHTRGHTGYRLRTGGQDIVFCGDLFHVMPVQLAAPSVTVCYDDNPDDAHATRMRFLEACVEDDSIVAAAHAPFPGLGAIGAETKGYVWHPLA